MNNEYPEIEALLSLTYEGYSPTEFIGKGSTAYVLKVEKAGEVKAVKIPKRLIFHDIIRDGIKPLIKLRGHPNIVEVYGNHCFEHDRGFPYYIMEFLDGQNLEQRLRENSGIGLDVDEAVNIMVGVANGIMYAHSKNIRHSDLRPPNVQITKKGAIKLTDFDLYKLALNKNNPEILLEFEEYEYSIKDRAGNSMGKGNPIRPSKDWLSNKARRGVFTEQLDIFQFSKMLYQTLTGDVLSGIPKPLSKRLGKEFIMLDEIIDHGYADDEDDINITLKEIIDILQSVRYTGDLPIFNNKVSNFNMQLDFSLENIVNINFPKEYSMDKKRKVQEIEREGKKILNNSRFLIEEYENIETFVKEKGMSDFKTAKEEINKILVRMYDRFSRDRNGLLGFIDRFPERVLKENPEYKLVDYLVDYVCSFKNAPNAIQDLCRNEELNFFK